MTGRRLRALHARHQQLEKHLADEMRRPAPDIAVVAKLKRQKLIVKDEIDAAVRMLRRAARGPADAPV
jgi:hypothetical protein